MKNSLRDKLQIALSEDIGQDRNNEYKVVYILSRIRKLMEHDKSGASYKVLRLFCNWSLHTEIDRTDEIKYILEEFVANEHSRTHQHLFKDFFREFHDYIATTFNISLSDAYINSFIKILLTIISDTPISFKKIKKTTIILNPESLPQPMDNEVAYVISEEGL